MLENKEIAFLVSLAAVFKNKSKDNLEAGKEAQDKQYIRNQIRACDEVIEKLNKMILQN